MAPTHFETHFAYVETPIYTTFPSHLQSIQTKEEEKKKKKKIP
jgi:hypothetical protein